MDENTFDLVLIGSGGGSFCAALTARAAGYRPLIVEKEDLIGGSTAMSGGVLWIPNNPVMLRAGVPDSPERARRYFDAVVGDAGPATSAARREAFLTAGPELVTFLERLGMKFTRGEGYSDYYDEKPGGESRSRSIVAEIFDTHELGAWEPKLRTYEFLPFPAHIFEVGPAALANRCWSGRRVALRLVARGLWAKLTGKSYAARGGALQGRMLQLALAHDVPIWTGAKVTSFVVEGQRVVGVDVEREGRPVRVHATRGVLINTGGFARNAAMRDRYQPRPASVAFTHANPGDTGEVLTEAMALGAATDLMDQSVWVTVSAQEDGTPPPGLPASSINVVDIAKPHSLIVDGNGQRYVNEAVSYMELGQTMYERHRTARAVPSWCILESRHRDYYYWGTQAPGQTPAAWIESGYMKKADTIEDLARQCRMPPETLSETITRFNGFVDRGVDADFGRGNRAYERFFGDPSVRPNPNLGRIDWPPFYAVPVFPGDVGTFGGLLTDEHARVLRPDGAPIAGLYATGNCTASVMGRKYPGAGASIAASFVFGMLAARHALSLSA
jgi:3-oxosteroid 1-dehydrogenase